MTAKGLTIFVLLIFYCDRDTKELLSGVFMRCIDNIFTHTTIANRTCCYVIGVCSVFCVKDVHNLENKCLENYCALLGDDRRISSYSFEE